MSKGPGRVQRAIRAIFAAEPDNAFTTAELCARVYGTRVTNKHRIAVIRGPTSITAPVATSAINSETASNSVHCAAAGTPEVDRSTHPSAAYELWI
jgi:hypothetical protein